MEEDIKRESCPFTPPSSPSRSSQQNGTNSSREADGVSLSPGLQSRGSPNSPAVNGQPKASSRGPFLIGVAGGTASGKTSVCRKIMEALEQVNSSNQRVVMISQDSFYKNLTSREIALANIGEYNFDHPDAFDTKLAEVTLKGILEGRTVQIPTYNFKTHSRGPSMKTVLPADVVLFEGILVLYDQSVRELMHMKLFVDTDSDTRLARRVCRDIEERGRDLEQVLKQYIHLVKPAFEEFTLPTKKYADVIIPRGAENTVAINLIVQHIKAILAGTVGIASRPPPVRRRTRRQSDSLLARPH